MSEPIDKTGYNCAGCTRPDHDESEMVLCDQCQNWYHFGCAGVTATVKDDSMWICITCDGKAASDSEPTELELELKKLEEEKKAQQRAMEKERVLHKKRLEIRQEMFLMRQKLEKEKRELELAYEKEQMEKEIAEEESFQRKREQMRKEMKKKLEEARQQRKESGDGAGEKAKETEKDAGEGCSTKGGKLKQKGPEKAGKKSGVKKSGKKPAKKAKAGQGAKPKSSTPKTAEVPPVDSPSLEESLLTETETPSSHPDLPKPRKNGKSLSEVDEDEDPEENDGSDDEEGSNDEDGSDDEEESNDEEDEDDRHSVVSKAGSQASKKPEENPPPKQQQGPTKAQLSARQFLSKKLPVFSGKLEDWPMFICSYETSSEACGFSNIENLARLQECLKGQALEAVRSRLLIPDAVPQIMETLRMLYGRPEQLLNMLLAKVRKAPPPKADRLITFINFGMTVQQLADHLEATKLTSHLVNPMLIQELTEKLPASTQLEWVRYRRKADVVTIRTLANFLSRIVRDASEVTSYGEAPTTSDHGNRKAKGNNREHESFLHTHGGQEPAHQTQPPKERTPCKACNRTDHRIRNCEAFRNLSLPHRLEAVRKWKLCSTCLNDHGNARCKLNIRCNIGTCREPHNPLLHSAGSETGVNCNIHSIQRKQPVIFRMMPVTLYWGNQAVHTVAFLDEGSSFTLVEKSLASALRTRGVSQPLRVTWTAGMSRLEKDSQRVELFISARGAMQRFHIKAAHTVDNLKLPQSTLDLPEVAKQYSHLQDLPLVDFQQTAPQILIGLKDIHLYAPLESRIGRSEEPIAVRSKLGWTIYGPTNGGIESAIVGHHECSSVSNQELHDLLRNQYTLEESGISVALLPESEEDKRAKALLTQTTVRVGDRFETGLLWREDSPCFPDSYPMAVKRLKCLERRLAKDNQLYERVRCLVSEYLEKGYAHKASETEIAETNQSKVWYLPLSVVINPKKPGKVRLVWDAAAAVEGVSLNSKLLKGPDMLTALPAVICKFREREVGFGADIKEMYHQLRIRKEDTVAQRFLFRESATRDPEIYVMDVATFGATSSPCSAQFVKNLNAKEYAGRFPEAAKAIVENHYVDDYFDSTETVEEAVKRAKEVKFVHSKGGFELRSWVSSSEEFLREMGEIKEEQCVRFNQDKETGHERVLGIVWTPASDEFTFSAKLREDLLPYLTGERRPTKRGVMSCIMSLFDPIGFLATFTIYGKMLIQDLWRSGCSWDQQIDDESYEKWNRWVGRLPEIEKVRIPRYHFTGGHAVDYRSLQLHVFVDASENAYGAVAYFRVMTASGPVCSLVMARSKVAPLKQLSIPRLELQGAVLGSRLMNSVIENHSVEVKQRFIWTDSRTVLSWIHSDQRRYKQFVAFRIGEIHSLTKLAEWRWVSTKNNIADDLTKWDRGHNLDSNGPWFRGPRFLYQPEDSWPKQTRISPNVPEEIRASLLFHDVALSEPIIDPLRFSRWKVLVRTIACVYRFASNCKRKRQGLAIEGVPTTDAIKKKVVKRIAATVVPLQRGEYQKAEAYLWRLAQADAYGDEVKTLQKNRETVNENRRQLEKSSRLYSLSPFLDEQNVLRMEGRTSQGTFLPFELRFPIILPKGHPVTVKLLEHYHQRVAHANQETAVNEIRQRFQISNLRAELKRVSKACIWCKVRKCQPGQPRMAPLPIARITPGLQPFSYTGVDYCGPLTVSIGRRSEKRWICLFTCLTTRAIHVEVAHSLTTQSCLMAIRRFVSFRGSPLEFFSDNGTNFHGASKEVVKQIEADCEDVFTDSRTRWNFNPPSAPHMGGVWERLVRSVKAVLAALNDGRRMTDEILLTVLAEAADLVNSRPLTYTGLEPDAEEALTPNHFVRGVGVTSSGPFVKPTNEAGALRDSFQRSQLLVDRFWQRWTTEYLPTINQRSKWHGETSPIARGDLVYIADEKVRKHWIRGIVTEVFSGADGRIRQALVKTAKGEFRRPVAKLAVLEIQERKSGAADTSSPELRGGAMFAPPTAIHTYREAPATAVPARTTRLATGCQTGGEKEKPKQQKQKKIEIEQKLANKK